jgi:hypothetical protein
MFLAARDNYVPASSYPNAKRDLDLNLIEMVKAQLESGAQALPVSSNEVAEVQPKSLSEPVPVPVSAPNVVAVPAAAEESDDDKELVVQEEEEEEQEEEEEEEEEQEEDAGGVGEEDAEADGDELDELVVPPNESGEAPVGDDDAGLADEEDW